MTFSPWTDLSCTAESYRRNADSEVMLPPEKVAEIAATYLGGADPKDPGASPLFGDFLGAPPVLIQASPQEIFWDDCVAMAEKLKDCRHVVLEDCGHYQHMEQVARVANELTDYLNEVLIPGRV